MGEEEIEEGRKRRNIERESNRERHLTLWAICSSPTYSVYIN